MKILVLSFRLAKEVRTQKYDGSKSIATGNRRRICEIITAAVIKTQYYGLRWQSLTGVERLQGGGKRNNMIVFLRQPRHLSRELFRINDVRGLRDSPNGPDGMIHKHPEA